MLNQKPHSSTRPKRPIVMIHEWITPSYTDNMQWSRDKWTRDSYQKDPFLNKAEPEWCACVAQGKMKESLTEMTHYSGIKQKVSSKWTNCPQTTYNYNLVHQMNFNFFSIHAASPTNPYQRSGRRLPSSPFPNQTSQWITQRATAPSHSSVYLSNSWNGFS